MNDLRRQGVDPLVVDGGNLLFAKRQLKPAEFEPLMRKARVIVNSYNAIGVDAVAVGPNDFAAGFAALDELRADAQFPFLCANIVNRETREPLFQPTAVVRRGGVTVGLIGVVDSALGARGLGPGGEAYRVEPLFGTVRHYAQELAPQCDVVVVVSAVPMKKFRLLAKKISEVSFYVAGDPQDKLRLPWTIGETMIASTTQLGKYLGSAQLSLVAPGRWQTTKHKFVPMKPECRDDPAVKRLVDGYYKYVAMQRRSTPEAYTQDAEERVNLKLGGAVYVSAAECGTCHPQIYDQWRGMPHASAWTQLPDRARSRLECLECHVTGLGRWGGYAAAAGPDLAGVQCEVCHGAGSLHPATELTRVERRQVTRQCRRCHTPSRSPDFILSAYLERIACTQVARHSAR